MVQFCTRQTCSKGSVPFRCFCSLKKRLLPEMVLLGLDIRFLMQVAVKSFNIAGASAVAEVDFAKEVHIAQLASATCQRACRILGCCKLDGSPCLVMSLYSSSAAKRLETLQGIW